jgi:hypothetical protein
VDASRRNWKAPDNKLLEILFMFTGIVFTGNFVHVYWKFCSCLLKRKKCFVEFLTGSWIEIARSYLLITGNGMVLEEYNIA